MNSVRVPPPVPPDRICQCSLCRQARGLEPLSEGELRRQRLERHARERTARRMLEQRVASSEENE